jgi:hypothetical protein
VSAGSDPFDAKSTPVDIDGDGLIEIYSLEQLDWVRNNLAGTSQHDGNSENATGCDTCSGYELMNYLDFDTNQSGTHDVGDVYFDYDKDGSNQGWLAIGDRNNPFIATFEGNNHQIKNLYINRNSNLMGLFGHTGDVLNSLSANLKNISLTGDIMSITVSGFSGALIGWADNTLIDNCSLQGV